MKKIFTLLLLAIAIISNNATAQNSTACNPAFSWQALSNLTYKFTPAIVTDSPYVQHYWSFGDGTGNTAGTITPVHTYPGPGTYNVLHYIVRHNPNGVLTCMDSLVKVLTIYPECNIQANFTVTTDSINPHKINFTNQTVNFNNSDSIRWNFGDGSVSYDINPSHIYANPGTYNVCLRIKRNNVAAGTAPCVSEICKTITIAQSTACNLHASFSWHADSTQANKIYFTNLSSPLANTDSIRWSFGDGTFSNHVSPDHIYATAGDYTVCLRIIKREANGALTNCIADTCYQVVVQAPCTLVAGFIAHKDSLSTVAYTYYFQNTSTPLAATDSIRWTFGDGATSNAVNPAHVYAQPGTYTVCLWIMKRTSATAVTNCIKETCTVLVVAPVCNIQPAYSWTKDSINNRKIYFTNLTASPVTNITFTWSFGDGTTATSYNAVHEYAQPGRYYVCLRAAYGTCITYKCDSITVLAAAPACTQLANYSYVKAAADNQLLYFTPAYVSSDIQYTWTFGDGTGSHDPVTSHRFVTSANYNVCLTAYRNAGCAATSCKSVTILPQINCDSVNVYFTDRRDSINPNKITFTAVSGQLILDQVWTITRSTASGGQVILHQNNPVYVFTDTGHYVICLKATTVGGCIKNYCKDIYITPLPASSCSLQAYPNPADNIVNINVQLASPQAIYAYLYNALNVLVSTKTQAGVTGSNVVTMNTTGLTAGMYTIKVVHGNDICYARFQKL